MKQSRPANRASCDEGKLIRVDVQVGTPEQQSVIRDELAFFERAAEMISLPLAISSVVVAADFDAVVNGLQGTSDYRSCRGYAVVAKVVDAPDGCVIVLSPLLYTAEFDYGKRLVFYAHELVHAANRVRLPQPLPSLSRAEYLRLSDLYGVFDEYYAVRLGLQILDDSSGKRTTEIEEYIGQMLDSYVRPLCDDSYDRPIREAIALYRSHGDVDRLLEEVRDPLDGVIQFIVRSCATYDACPWLGRSDQELDPSPLWTDQAKRFIRFLRDKYEARSIDLFDGLGIFIEFTDTMGIRLEDTVKGLYCRVL